MASGLWTRRLGRTLGPAALFVQRAIRGKTPQRAASWQNRPSREERDHWSRASDDDSEFAEVVTRQERDPATKLIEKVHNIDMLPDGAYSAISLAK